MARKISKPVENYGYPPDFGTTQLDYDVRAFANRRATDYGVPPLPVLFRRISDCWLPGHFEWHAWTDRLIECLCTYDYLAVIGCSNCVSGKTRILDPITGEQPTIKWLCEQQIAPMVMTLDGAFQADVPFKKGAAEMLEFTLEDGRRFEAVAGHRVYTSNGFECVESFAPGQALLAYAECHPQSISERDPLIHAQDAIGFPQTIQDFPNDCRLLCHSCDEQLLFGQDNGQATSPSPIGALKHIQDNLRKDAPVSRCARNHVDQLLDPPSSCDADHRRIVSGRRVSRLRGLKTAELVGRSFPQFWQFLLGNDYPEPSSGQVHDFVCKQMCAAWGYMVAPMRIVSIKKLGVQPFYDISVPGPEHYFAEGVIHHNSAKTRNVASFSATWWLCNPAQSSVTFVSTSIKSLRRRGWAEIQNAFYKLGEHRKGNFVDSRLLWQHERGDDKHAIIGKAVEEGPLVKVADDIKGVHTIRQLLCIDEATAVPPAIHDAANNLYSYPKEFKMVIMFNPRRKLDRCSQFCEPKDGWLSLDVDESTEWDGKPVPELGGAQFHVLRFDAEKSPNITEGKIVSTHLPTEAKVNAARLKSGGQTPLYWTNFRGFWPPEGLNKTVFTESAISMNDGAGTFTFTGEHFTILGMFDPAFGGGDLPALRFAKLGELAGGKFGIQLYPAIILPINSQSNNPVHFQLAEQLRRQCEKVTLNGVDYVCHPQNLGVDATGEGGGLCDIIGRTWSPKILRIEFGSSASDDPCNLEDIRPACDVYENKAAEMWFRSRDALNSGQLKGIDPDTAEELCNRQFDDSGKRIVLQSKSKDKPGVKSYRTLFGNSPDLADSAVGIIEVARIRGFRLAPVGQTQETYDEWDQRVAASQAVYETAGQYQEEAA